MQIPRGTKKVWKQGQGACCWGIIAFDIIQGLLNSLVYSEPPLNRPSDIDKGLFLLQCK